MKRNLPCQRRPPDLWLGRGFDSFTRSPSGTPRLSARAINSWSVTQRNWASIFESVPRLRSSRRTVLRTVNSWSWLVGVMGTASKRFDYDRPFLRRANEAVLPKGAEYAWMVLLDYGHEYAENRLDLLIMPLMDLAVRTRYE